MQFHLSSAVFASFSPPRGAKVSLYLARESRVLPAGTALFWRPSPGKGERIVRSWPPRSLSSADECPRISDWLGWYLQSQGTALIGIYYYCYGGTLSRGCCRWLWTLSGESFVSASATGTLFALFIPWLSELKRLLYSAMLETFMCTTFRAVPCKERLEGCSRTLMICRWYALNLASATLWRWCNFNSEFILVFKN